MFTVSCTKSHQLITKSSLLSQWRNTRTRTHNSSPLCSSFFSTTTRRNDNDPSKNVVIVDGIRLPFAMSSTIYSDEMAVDLQRLAYKGLMDKTALDKKEVDYVISGTVIQEVRTSNLAREAAINAGLPKAIGGHTVSMVSQNRFCRKFYGNASKLM